MIIVFKIIVKPFNQMKRGKDYKKQNFQPCFITELQDITSDGASQRNKLLKLSSKSSFGLERVLPLLALVFQEQD